MFEHATPCHKGKASLAGWASCLDSVGMPDFNWGIFWAVLAAIVVAYILRYILVLIIDYIERQL